MKPYQPDKLPLENLDYRLLLPLVGTANAELARYDGLLQGMPNPAVMLSPLTTREAVLSSKIEGTQATVDEVLEQEAGLEKQGEKYKDILEISNYRQALFKASEHLKDYPIRLPLIRELHRILLDSVRGQNKTPGEFRIDQNWIGKFDCTMDEASFVPPSPFVLNDCLQAWERYLDSNDIDFLLQTAVVHAQFELIHPFKDGNGRIGRILIPLFLYQKKVLSQPMFYLSQFLEENREEYYVRLGAISAEGDWNGWIAFFLKAICVQARENNQRVKSIMTLYEEMKLKFQDITHSQYAVYLLDAVFAKPIFKTSDIVNQLHQSHGVHKKTGAHLIRQLRDAMVLNELLEGKGKRSSVMCLPLLLNTVEGREVVHGRIVT